MRDVITGFVNVVFQAEARQGPPVPG